MIAGATFSMQVLTTLVSPIITRLYTPSDYGIFSAFSSISTILLAINSLRYELAITLPRDDEKAANLLALCLLLVVLSSGVFWAALWLLRDHIGVWTNTPEIAGFLWLMPVTLIGAGSYQALSYWAIRKKSFGVLARTKIVQGVGTVVLRIALGVLQTGAIGLIISQIFSLSAGIWSIVSGDYRTLLYSIRWERMVTVAKEYRRFPLISAWSSLLNTAGLQLPTLFMLALYGPVAGGVFALGLRMVQLPAHLVGSSVAQVYLGTASEIKNQAPAQLKPLFIRTTRRLFLVGLVPIVLIVLFGPEVFSLVFGAEWQAAGQYVRLLGPAILIQFVISPISQTMIVLERQDLQLGWDVARILLTIAAFGSAAFAGWSAETAVAAYAVVFGLSYILLIALNWHAIQQHTVKIG
ncbi:MAG: oligosaccharide flippase family protein [Chloroflexota bacterium]